MKTNTKGFTVIEMLIVIAMIAILSGAVMTSMISFQQSARDTRRIADLKNTQSYLELYFTRCGHYPGITDPVTSCSDAFTGGGKQSWIGLTTALGKVMEGSIPTDPVTARSYEYFYTSDGLRYLLKGTLEKENSVTRKNADGTDFNTLCTEALVYCPQR